MNYPVSRSPVKKVSRLRPEDRGRAAFHPHSMYRVPEFSGENALTELDYLPKGGLEHRARVMYSRNALRNEVLGVKPGLNVFEDDHNVKPGWYPGHPDTHAHFPSLSGNGEKEKPSWFNEDGDTKYETFPIRGSFSGFDYEEDVFGTVRPHESRSTDEVVSEVTRYSKGSQDSVRSVSDSGAGTAYTCKVERTTVFGRSDPRRSYTCVPYDYSSAPMQTKSRNNGGVTNPRGSYNCLPYDYSSAPRHSENTNNWAGTNPRGSYSCVPYNYPSATRHSKDTNHWRGRGISVSSFGSNGKSNQRGGNHGPVYNAGKY